MNRSLVQVVPGAPPLVNGVADYALTIARTLRSRHEIESTFLVCNPSWDGPRSIDGFALDHVRSRRGDELLAALVRQSERMDEPAVLLQLSPYGFASTGAPFWLLDALRRWKGQRPKRKLITYFHELYGTSPPWRRGFWLSPFQRACSRAIARLSDSAITNMRLYADRLARWDPRKADSIGCVPITSNVGEPDELAPLRARRRRLVIWGAASAKRDLYTRHLPLLEGAVHGMRVVEVLDIGSRWPDAPWRIADVPVLANGILEAGVIGDHLKDGIMAVCAYHADYLAKSTLFAAFCAHRMPALVLSPLTARGTSADGLVDRTHYMTSLPRSASGEAFLDEAQRVADAAHEWYMPHASSKHADRIDAIMREDDDLDREAAKGGPRAPLR